MQKRNGPVLLLIVALLLAACGAPATTTTTPTAPVATEAAPPAVTTAPTSPPAAEPTSAPAPAATTAAATAPTGPIKIGIMGPFTGGAASIGQEQLNYAKLAVEDFNKANGTTVELVEGDTQLDPAIATDVAQRLISDQAVYAIVGPAGSQEVLAVAPSVTTANLVMISPSATRVDLTESGFKTFFRVVPRDDVQGQTAGNLIADTLKATKVALIDDQTAYSTGLADQVASVLAAKNVATTRTSITQNDSDFSSLVTKLKGEAPQVVYIPWQLANQAALLAKQMQEQGFTATIMGGDGLNSQTDFIDGAAGATEGAYITNFAPDITSVADAKAVVDAFTAKYGTFGAFGPPTYVATMVALEAIQRAGAGGSLSREAVTAEVAKTDMAKSIFGIPIKFDAKGDIQNATFFLFQVKDGKFVAVTQ